MSTRTAALTAALALMTASMMLSAGPPETPRSPVTDE
jgi:hypothetical protein